MTTYKYVPLSHEVRLKKLLDLGHFHKSFGGHARKADLQFLTTRKKAWTEGVQSFQEYRGLKPDGKWGPLTDTVAANNTDAWGNPIICGHPDIPPGVEESKIPNGTVTWPDPEQPISSYIDFALPGLTKQKVQEAFAAVFDNINSNIGIRFALTNTKSKAHALIRKENMSGGTLAYSVLSMGHRRLGEHYQAYAANTQWDLEADNGISLIGVGIHEYLHLAGYSHSKNRADILWASYNSAILRMAQGDIARCVRDYPPFDEPDKPDPKPGGKMTYSGRLLATDEQGNSRPALFEQKVTFL